MRATYDVQDELSAASHNNLERATKAETASNQLAKTETKSESSSWEKK